MGRRRKDVKSHKVFEFFPLDSEIREVREYMDARHISLKPEWESEACTFIKSSMSKIGGAVDISTLCKMILYQWLYSDLAESSRPVLKIPERAYKIVITNSSVMQIEAIQDISKPSYEQYRVMTKNPSDKDNEVFEKDEMKENKISTSKSLLMYDLFDGETHFKAIATEAIDGLDDNILLGAKLLLIPKIVFRNKCIKLTSKNCQFLGGNCERLMYDTKLKALCQKLDKDPSEAFIKCLEMKKSLKRLSDENQKSHVLSKKAHIMNQEAFGSSGSPRSEFF